MGGCSSGIDYLVPPEKQPMKWGEGLRTWFTSWQRLAGVTCAELSAGCRLDWKLRY